MGTSVQIWMLIAGRFIVGMGVGLSSQSVPLYITEVASPKYRGGLVSLNQLCITIGIMVSYGINFGFDSYPRGWSYSLGLGATPALILVVGMYFLPETPYYLVIKGRDEDARRVLVYLRKRNDVSLELDDMRKSNIKGMEENEPKWSEIFHNRNMLKIQMIGAGLTIFQQFVGVNAVIYYAPEIFIDVGYSTSATLFATLIVGIVNVVTTALSVWLVDVLGRRVLLLFGSAVMAATMLVLGVLAALDMFKENHALGIVAIISVCLFIVGFAISWGPIAWLIPSEIFPLRLRGKMTTVSTFGNWGSNLIVSMCFLILFNAITWGVFIIFTILCIFSGIFVYFAVPETKNKSLDELQKNMG